MFSQAGYLGVRFKVWPGLVKSALCPLCCSRSYHGRPQGVGQAWMEHFLGTLPQENYTQMGLY